jgi:hypothetical protein
MDDVVDFNDDSIAIYDETWFQAKVHRVYLDHGDVPPCLYVLDHFVRQ